MKQACSENKEEEKKDKQIHSSGYFSVTTLDTLVWIIDITYFGHPHPEYDEAWGWKRVIL